MVSDHLLVFRLRLELIPYLVVYLDWDCSKALKSNNLASQDWYLHDSNDERHVSPFSHFVLWFWNWFYWSCLTFHLHLKREKIDQVRGLNYHLTWTKGFCQISFSELQDFSSNLVVYHSGWSYSYFSISFWGEIIALAFDLHLLECSLIETSYTD